jgi:hypothetical protein
MNPYEAARLAIDAAQDERTRFTEALPDLSPVISWLENGCDPQSAATELRIYKARIDAALSLAKSEKQL